MKDGGYDIGYQKCGCFWGNYPGSLVMMIDKYTSIFEGITVLDLGCGEGKNSLFFANKGAFVDAFDISDYAIRNAINNFGYHPNIQFKVADALDLNLKENAYDICISYGLSHCLNDKAEITKLLSHLIKWTKKGGLLIFCAFNSRKQDLSAHIDFHPCLLSHSEYLDFFNNYNILFQSDKDLHETHPHNLIPHMHSMTRLIIRI